MRVCVRVSHRHHVWRWVAAISVPLSYHSATQTGTSVYVEWSAVHQRNCAAYVTAFSHRRDEEATLFPNQRWADTTPRGCTHPAHVNRLPFQRGVGARAGAQRTHTHPNPCHVCSLRSIVDLDKGCVCVCGTHEQQQLPAWPNHTKTDTTAITRLLFLSSTDNNHTVSRMHGSIIPSSLRARRGQRECVRVGELFSQVNFLLSLR
jgi:hypothetical protein